MLLKDLMKDIEIVTDETEIVIIGQGWRRRGNWYEDHMLKVADEYAESKVRCFYFRDYQDFGSTVEITLREDN